MLAYAKISVFFPAFSKYFLSVFREINDLRSDNFHLQAWTFTICIECFGTGPILYNDLWFWCFDKTVRVLIKLLFLFQRLQRTCRYHTILSDHDFCFLTFRIIECKGVKIGNTFAMLPQILLFCKALLNNEDKEGREFTCTSDCQ